MKRAVSAHIVARHRWLAMSLLALLGLVVLYPRQIPAEALLQRDTTIEDRSYRAAKAESALLISVVRDGEVVAGDPEGQRARLHQQALRLWSAA